METGLQLSEIALLSNMQSIGPFFISDASGLITPDIGMLLAARLVITSGIGNVSAKTMELFGPLPVPELDDDSYLCYLFNVEMQQQPLPGSTFSTGKGTLIFCLIFPERIKDEIYKHRTVLERILREYAGVLDFSETITGMISPEIKGESEEMLKKLFNEVNEAILLAAEYHGASLFDIGFLASLPEDLSLLAKQLIQQPNGWKEEDISDSDNISKLVSVGLVKPEVRDGETWYIPQ
ncbi:MAG: hypothetical protein INQ03_13450 [Candidatus Heimdallarchaeota archaeon]|nr:hypothetical protein [Candidatus Heimdallarchaeota archaeon]